MDARHTDTRELVMEFYAAASSECGRLTSKRDFGHQPTESGASDTLAGTIANDLEFRRTDSRHSLFISGSEDLACIAKRDVGDAQAVRRLLRQFEPRKTRGIDPDLAK